MSAQSNSLRVLRVGSCGPLGMSARQVAMAFRARRLEPRSCKFKDKRRAAIGVVRCRWLLDDVVGRDRFVQLAAPALREAMTGFTEPVPIVLAGPPTYRPDMPEKRLDDLPKRIASAAEVTLNDSASQMLYLGHAGFAYAIQQAAELLEKGHPLVVVGGVDSYYQKFALKWLDGHMRLHALGTENGIIPGEGAAFALLTSSEGPTDERLKAKLAHVEPLAEVVHWSAAEEPEVKDQQSMSAETMTKLAQDAIEALGTTPSWVLTDVNPEVHRINEWVAVELRCDLGRQQALHQRLPSDAGDVGAASGAMMLALASTFWEVGCAPASEALLALHSDTAERGVLALRRPT